MVNLLTGVGKQFSWRVAGEKRVTREGNEEERRGTEQLGGTEETKAERKGKVKLRVTPNS